MAIARAAAEGSGLPVSVKLRSGARRGDRSGFELALRLADETPIAAISFHPRPASVHHSGSPDYELARELHGRLEGSGVKMIISGGLSSADRVRAAYEQSEADAVMIARGALGNPWIFERLLSGREGEPSEGEVVAELLWVLERAEEHWGERAARNLRKFYPWYLERLGLKGAPADIYQRTESLDEVRGLLSSDFPAPLRALSAAL